MKHEVHTCDRCGKSAATKEEQEVLNLGTLCLGFATNMFYSQPRVHSAHHVWTREWCQACRTELGCLEPKVREAAQNGTPVTSLEDLVREIVREEVQEVVQ